MRAVHMYSASSVNIATGNWWMKLSLPSVYESGTHLWHNASLSSTLMFLERMKVNSKTTKEPWWVTIYSYNCCLFKILAAAQILRGFYVVFEGSLLHQAIRSEQEFLKKHDRLKHWHLKCVSYKCHRVLQSEYIMQITADGPQSARAYWFHW